MTELLIRILATWRIANLLVSEEGPAEIFVKLRHYFGVRKDDKDRTFVEGDSEQRIKFEVGKALTCIWCLSPWVGLACSFLPTKFLLPFALSAGALLVNKKVNNG